MNINPLRRSPIVKKAKQHKESMPWRRKKVRLDAGEMANLRRYVYERSIPLGDSRGMCENSPWDGGNRCPARITWFTMELAHIESRGRGGSDVKENVLACCRDCHDEDTRNRHKLHPHREWIA